MRRKSLNRLVATMLVSSSSLIPVSVQANEMLYQRYWQSVSDHFRMPAAHYRFRPVAAAPAMAYGQRPVRFSFNQAWQPRNSGYRFRPQQRPQLMAFQPVQYKAPAFARQFNWAPAPATVFRKGGSKNFYASESNTAMESAFAPAYRSEPVNTQGYRFRSSQRSAPYVSFSDRVRDAGSQQQLNSYQQANPAAVAFRAPPMMKPQMPVLSMPPQPIPPAMPMAAIPEPVMPPQMSRDIPVQVFMSSQPLPSADGYDFRPDNRFEPTAKPVISRPKVQPLRPAKPAQAPVVVDNVQIARAQFPEGVGNPWNNWSFRPMDSALQR